MAELPDIIAAGGSVRATALLGSSGKSSGLQPLSLDGAEGMNFASDVIGATRSCSLSPPFIPGQKDWFLHITLELRMSWSHSVPGRGVTDATIRDPFGTKMGLFAIA